MKSNITAIEHMSNESVKVTAIVYWRGLPRPHYEDNETDEQYADRVGPIAQELNSYNNLHIGWADLKQDISKIEIPKVAEYDS